MIGIILDQQDPNPDRIAGRFDLSTALDFFFHVGPSLWFWTLTAGEGFARHTRFAGLSGITPTPNDPIAVPFRLGLSTPETSWRSNHADS
jgi:hypothetical protein